MSGGGGPGARAAWLDPAGCPAEPPPRAALGEATRALHDAIDAHARATGARWLHPVERTIQRDLLGAPEVVAWQAEKARLVAGGERAWSELPHLYARYGTPGTAELLAALRELEGAPCALVTDCGMQAVALVVDALLTRGGHAVMLRQVYNKTRAFLEWTVERLGAGLTVVDDGDPAAVGRAVTPATQLVLAETYTNPLLRAQDVPALAAAIRAACPATPLVLDTTIATPWGLCRPALASGAAVVTGSLTKGLGGRDLALGGYIATTSAAIANRAAELIAMRGGILDDARARAVAAHLPEAARAHARRCATAAAVARFLAAHPRVERVHHPALPDHPDAAVIARDYARTGSIVALRAAGADDAAHRHLADALATTGVLRYALSFDGVVTKVNHHRTVSESSTPIAQVERAGLDRLIRLAIGLEEPEDLIACLNWALHHGAALPAAAIEAWRAARAAELGAATLAPPTKF